MPGGIDLVLQRPGCQHHKRQISEAGEQRQAADHSRLQDHSQNNHGDCYQITHSYGGRQEGGDIHRLEIDDDQNDLQTVEIHNRLNGRLLEKIEIARADIDHLPNDQVGRIPAAQPGGQHEIARPRQRHPAGSTEAITSPVTEPTRAPSSSAFWRRTLTRRSRISDQLDSSRIRDDTRPHGPPSPDRSQPASRAGCRHSTRRLIIT
ncbi:MAG: hypothetical protein MZV70_21245 [Desulfobacterales bacterium]|nr:hypothetical protein [Desulfobacterales bacterium]